MKYILCILHYVITDEFKEERSIERLSIDKGSKEGIPNSGIPDTKTPLTHSAACLISLSNALSFKGFSRKEFLYIIIISYFIQNILSYKKYSYHINSIFY